MTSDDDFAELILEVIDSGEEVLIASGGVVFKGHLASCRKGVIGAVVSRVGDSAPPAEHKFRVNETHVERMELGEQLDADVAELLGSDDLLAQSRRMVNAAREYGSLTLAERLIRDQKLRKRVE